MSNAAIVAWAWRTPLGSDVDAVVSRLFAGERAGVLQPYAEGFLCKTIAPIPGAPRPSRHERFLRRMGCFALDVAADAFASGELHAVPSDRVGVFAAVSGLRVCWEDLMGAFARQLEGGAEAWSRGLKAMHPFFLLRHLSNNAHALVAADLGVRGEGATFAGANAGAQAIAAATRALHARAVDAALVLAYDSQLEPESLVELAARGSVSCELPRDVRPPYDEAARGAVPGEAAAAVVLERPADARARPLALVEARAHADGQAGEPLPETIGRGVRGLSRDDAIVDGAARAHRRLDDEERAALAGVLGAKARLVATCAAMGRLGAATSVVQTIAIAGSLRRGGLAPIAGLRAPAPGPLQAIVAPTAAPTNAAIAVATGAPGLVGAVRVEVTR